MIKKVVGMYFSPSGETEKITKKIVDELYVKMNDACIDNLDVSYVDLLFEPLTRDALFDDETVVVVGMPAYTGRLPLPCVKMIQKIHGANTMAVCAVAYGNSSYGDSLYELYSFLEDQGFDVVSAGAFISQHAIFGRIAESRPDRYDWQMINEFCSLTAKKLHRFCSTAIAELRGKPGPLDIRGSMPSRGPLHIPIHPTPNSKCVQCGKCAEICPTKAIDPNDTSIIDTRKCISCTACIRVCEYDSRGFHGPMCAASRIAFEKLYSKRKEPEWFL